MKASLDHSITRPLDHLFFFILLLSFAAKASAAGFDNSAVGTSSGQFLKLGAGSRGMAMGEACSAAADDAGAVYWNPAALLQIESSSVVLMHAVYLDTIFYDFAAFGRKLKNNTAWGAGLQYLSVGSIAETDGLGLETGKFNPHDYALTFSGARRFTRRDDFKFLAGYDLGVSLKYIHSTIVRSADTIAVDLGVVLPERLGGRLRLAAVMQNFGGKLRYDLESRPLPLTFKAGAAYRLTPQWLLALDAAWPRDNGPAAGAGMERWWPASAEWSLAARAGFNSRTAGDLEGLSGLSFGFGLRRQRGEKRSLTLDYALVSFGPLGLTHRISLSGKF